MEPETKGIRYQSATYPKVQNLMHNVNEQTLMLEHRRQARKKATGIDGVDKTAHDENAEENIRELVRKMKKFQYRPQAVRRTYIPKANGKMRPLGIPAYEDRLVQGVMAGLLNEVYEVRFLDCSYWANSHWKWQRTRQEYCRLDGSRGQRKTLIFWGLPFTTPKPEVGNIGLEYVQARRN